MTAPKAIIFSKNQIDILSNHSKENIPNESCAILFGSTCNDETIVKEIFLTKNIENSPINFTISPDELILAYGTAEKKGLEVSGIFHSHPGSVAYPSSTDKKYMETNPVPWVIFSNLSNEFKAYIYNSDIVPVPVKIL
ncbi:MAG: M67 family metallopeptidase [Thaumarchaeota archaeon]|nr:M67 family metallopeptidase [Nitrososphaerota archaeon]